MNSNLQRHHELQAMWISAARRALRLHYREIAVEIANKLYSDENKNSSSIEPAFQTNPTRKSSRPKFKPNLHEAVIGVTTNMYSNKPDNHAPGKTSFITRIKNSKLVEKISDWIKPVKVLFEPAGLFLIAIMYACIGGGVYCALEYRNEKHNLEISKALVDLQISMAAKNISEHYSSSLSDFNQSLTEAHAKAVIGNLVSGVGAYPEWEDYNHWDYAGSVWFAITIFTTIGYGNYTPKTMWGLMFTIVYAIVGIPMMLLVLSETGKMFSWILKKIYNKIAKFYLNQKRKYKSEIYAGSKKADEVERNNSLLRSNPSEDPAANAANPSKDAMETPHTATFYTQEQLESFDFPIFVSICLLIAFILLASAFSYSRGLFEKSYFNSIYFWMITLTTIGLGDFTPDDPAIAILCFPCFVTGLALLSMIITLIQVRMQEMEELILDDYLGFVFEDDQQPDPKKCLPAGPHGSTMGIFQAQTDPNTHKQLGNVLEIWKKKQPIFSNHPKEPNKIMVPKDVAKLVKSLQGGGTVIAVPKVDQETQTD